MRPLARTSAKHEAGFSLIELVVVLAIVAIVLAVAIPAFGKRNDFAILRANALGVSAKLRLLRAAALQSNRPASMTFDTTARSVSYDPAKSVTQLPQGIQLSVTMARLASDDGRQTRIMFFPDGSSTGMRLQLVSGPDKCVVEVLSLTGAVSFDECRS